MKLRKLVLVSCLSLFAADAIAATVTAVRSWRAPDNTRLVLDLSETVRYRQVSMSARQLVIELDNTDVAVAAPSLPSHIGLMQSVQFQTDGTKQRLIINLSDDVRPHVFLLPANDKYSPRLVIDLFDKVTMQATTPVEEEPAENNEGNNGRSVIVVVDAGHGGEDSGAIGANGHYEKHVTLAIAKKLVAILRKTNGFKAYLTRDEDYFIPLQDRRKIARNRYKADIFISIHADSSPSPLARGASVFALSRKGATTATSRFAQALAEKENKSDLIGGVDVEAGKDSQLTNILADMVVEGSLTHSLHMGGEILSELSDIGPLHTRHIEQAGFAVLKEPGMISVLVETGFISNPDEEAKLTNADDQQRTAQSVFNGVKGFLQKYPIPRTYFAWSREQRSGKQRSQALQAVTALPEPKQVKLEVIPLKRVEIPVTKVVEPVSVPVVPKALEQEKKPVVDVVKPVVVETRAGVAERAIVVESRPLSPVGVKAGVQPKTEVNVIDVAKAIHQQPVKAPVAATLPHSLDDFMAGIPQSTPAKTTTTAKASERKLAPKSSQEAKSKAETLVKAEPKVDEAAKVDIKKSPVKALKHTVTAGESLSTIAVANNVSVDELKAWNKLKNDNALLGTTLRLTAPLDKVTDKATEVAPALVKSVDKNTKTEKAELPPEKATSKTKTDKPTAESVDKAPKVEVSKDKTKQPAVPDGKGNGDNAKPKLHKVKEGDSLSSIASKYGVSEKALRETNHLKSDNVMLGQSLKIPTP